MLYHMKTTIDLPDELVVAAKKRAADQRTTLRAIFERGLRRELRTSTPRPGARAGRIRWLTVRGGVPEGLDLTDRTAMHDRLRKTRG